MSGAGTGETELRREYQQAVEAPQRSSRWLIYARYKFPAASVNPSPKRPHPPSRTLSHRQAHRRGGCVPGGIRYCVQHPPISACPMLRDQRAFLS